MPTTIRPELSYRDPYRLERHRFGAIAAQSIRGTDILSIQGGGSVSRRRPQLQLDARNPPVTSPGPRQKRPQTSVFLSLLFRQIL